GDPDRLFRVLEADVRQHLAEDLLARDPHVRADIHEDRRLDELATGLVGGGTAPEDAAGAFLARDVDVVEDLAVLRWRGDRADVGVGLHGVALARRRTQFGHAVDELVPYGVLHEQPGAGDAGLAGRGEDDGDRPGRGLVQVAVLEHDVRRLAAELQRHPLHRLRGLRIDAGAGRVRAGEGDLGHVGV